MARAKANDTISPPEVNLTSKKRPSKRGGPRPGSGKPPGVPIPVARVRSAIQLKFLAKADVAIQTLINLMTDKKLSPSERQSAARDFLDRGLGKVPEQQQITGADGGPIQTQQQHVVAVADLSVLGRGDLKTLETLLAHTLVAQGESDEEPDMKLIN